LPTLALNKKLIIIGTDRPYLDCFLTFFKELCFNAHFSKEEFLSISPPYNPKRKQLSVKSKGNNISSFQNPF